VEPIKRDLRTFISAELGRPVAEVGDQESLLEAGILDSMGVLALVSFIQARYEISVTDDEMMPENFDTLDAIAAFVASKRTQANA
jgi:acyl carrier protein